MRISDWSSDVCSSDLSDHDAVESIQPSRRAWFNAGCARQTGGSATSASPMIEDVAQELPLAGETARRIRQLTTKGICGDGRLSFSIASVSARFGDEERRVETNPRAARSACPRPRA